MSNIIINVYKVEKPNKHKTPNSFIVLDVWYSDRKCIIFKKISTSAF